MTSNARNFDVLVDSDTFVAYFFGPDALHEEAKALLSRAGDEKLRLVTTSFVVAETATVLSAISGAADARYFLDVVRDIPTIHITEELQAASLEFFKQQSMRHMSVVDCSNVVVMRKFGIPRIYSFDRFYRHQLGLKPAA